MRVNLVVITRSKMGAVVIESSLVVRTSKVVGSKAYRGRFLDLPKVRNIIETRRKRAQRNKTTV